MIGYYVHHHGHGHLHRAQAVALAMGEPVTGLSSLPRPLGWPGPWIELDRDDDEDAQTNPTARDRLHWVPLGHRGLRSRMAEIASWLRHLSPTVFVVDVSVEVAVLVRLHGIPVVTMVVPGRRGDAAHRLGFDVADTMIGCWPPAASGMLRDVSGEVQARVHAVGALSRFPVAVPEPRMPGPPRVVLMSGSGGTNLDAASLDRARQQTPDWEWKVLDRHLGSWVEDPRTFLRDADVVITHAGQGSLGEVASARRPAVIVPQPRPHDEQLVAADALAGGPWPALVVDGFADADWAVTLPRAAGMDGARWSSWCDGHAGERVARLIRATALRESVPLHVEDVL